MKFTNDEMFQNIMTMSNLYETGRLGYAIARNLRKMKDEAKEYIEIRDQLLDKYGTDNGDGKYSIDQENVPEFTAEIEKYANIEHDVDVFQISEADFVSGNLNSQQMYILDWMVLPKEAHES